MPKVTSRDLLASPSANNDLLHLVDVSDTTQSPEGSSFKATRAQVATQTFADAAARAVAVPGFIGQYGIQLDTTRLYISTGTSAGNWALMVNDFITLTDASTVVWDYLLSPNAVVTITDDRALSITNAPNGSYGTLYVIQGAGGNHALSLPASSKVINNGAGVIPLTSAEGSEDILSWSKRNGVFSFTYGLDYTAA